MNLTAVDFLRTRSQPGVGWGLLFTGIAMFAAVLAIDRQWAAERDGAERQKQETLAARQLRPTPLHPPELSIADRRLQQVRTEQRRPWLAALSAIEAATVHPVYLLSLNIEPSTGVVRLEAEAPSFEKALTYVEALGASGSLHPATLVSHAPATAQPSDLPVVRFSAITQWSVR